jgi:hypothetical protein
MKYYEIYWGVAGGYGGIMYSAIICTDSLDKASAEAYDLSYEECETYGIGDDDDEDIENWLDYSVREYDGNKDRLLSYHYTNFTDNHDFDFCL